MTSGPERKAVHYEADQRGISKLGNATMTPREKVPKKLRNRKKRERGGKSMSRVRQRSITAEIRRGSRMTAPEGQGGKGDREKKK